MFPECMFYEVQLYSTMKFTFMCFLQTFNKEYTEEHLKNYLTVPTTIPITSNTNGWVGTRVRINKVATGHAVMTTNWPDVVTGAEIKDGDICMFCFYDGTRELGCFVTRLSN